MVCYTVPLVAAISHFIMRRNIGNWKESISQRWLGLLLAGGAIFGLVDHWWNGELLLIGENLVFDLLLGVAITVAIVIVWAVITIFDKSKQHNKIKA